MTSPSSPSDIERAWQYHAAADELLHSRLEALMIAHAFLAIAFIELVSSSYLMERAAFVDCLVAGVTGLALLLTLLIGRINGDLSRALRWLKYEHLVHDPVYRGYIDALTGSKDGVGRPYPKIWSKWIPFVLVGFWLFTSGLYVFARVTRLL